MSVDQHKRILVTGFRPFCLDSVEVTVNASEEAIGLLNKDEIESALNVTLERRKLEVEYDFIDSKLPVFLAELHPHLTIHVGIADVDDFIIEKFARRGSYCIGDVNSCTPRGEQHSLAGPDIVETNMDVDSIVQQFNTDLPGDMFAAYASEDAKLYLCEYTYYMSLCQQNVSHYVLFVHVPPSETQDEFEQLARGLERLIVICVDQIRKQDSELYTIG